MRRYVAGGLLLALVSQSSGLAVASTGAAPAWQLSIAPLTQPIIAAIARSHIVARVTGNGDRYGAMHAPVPHIALPRAVDAAAIEAECRN